ncbi:MAG: hypothetical protein ACKN9S_01080 [Pirellula sp.]
MALLVGGSGLYLKAISQGMTPPAVPPQPQLRAQLDALGQPLCHALLSSADPTAAARIMPRDAVRTQRALEVLYATGQPLSAQQGATPPPWTVLELGLNPRPVENQSQADQKASDFLHDHDALHSFARLWTLVKDIHDHRRGVGECPFSNRWKEPANRRK